VSVGEYAGDAQVVYASHPDTFTLTEPSMLGQPQPGWMPKISRDNQQRFWTEVRSADDQFITATVQNHPHPGEPGLRRRPADQAHKFQHELALLVRVFVRVVSIPLLISTNAFIKPFYIK